MRRSSELAQTWAAAGLIYGSQVEPLAQTSWIDVPETP
jgi:hypothetical protein